MKWKSNRGFSFIEILSILPVLAILGTGVNSLLHRGRNNPSQEEGLAIIIASGRTAVDRMVQEIGLVGSTPVNNIAEGDVMPSSTLSDDTPSPFLVAEPSLLVFDADINSDGTKERIEYRLNENTLERAVTTISSDGSKLDTQYSILATDVENGAFPLFTYWGDQVGKIPQNGVFRSVRVLLLLKEQVPGTKRKEYKTVGYEGIANITSQSVADSTTPPEPLDLQGALELPQEISLPLDYKLSVKSNRILGIMR